MKVNFIGHSTFLITLSSGTVLLTDPWFGRPLLGRRTVPPALTEQEIRRCDMMVISHAHRDHFDHHALNLAKRLGSIIIGSVKAVKKAKKFGINQVFPIQPVDVIEIDKVRVQAVSAKHPVAKDAVGFVLNADGKTIFFSGDTRYHQNLLNDLKGFEIDVAILQIACTIFFGKEDGLTARTAAKLVREIKPKLVIPMHYHISSKVSNPSNKKTPPTPVDLVHELADTQVEVRTLTVGMEEKVG